jgi:hypothetical protein
MYIDSLTITALVIFIGALYLFIRFCMLRICGMKVPDNDEPSGNEVPRRGRT